MVMEIRYYVACCRGEFIQRYYGNITADLSKAEKWLVDAKKAFPLEDWHIYSFYD